MFESNVRSVLKDYAVRLRAIPERERNYGVTKKLTEELNKALPAGWKGWVSSCSVSVHQVPSEDPDETGRPVEVKYMKIYLWDIDTVREEVNLKFPSDCCAYCGTPKVYFTSWECPVCGAV